MAYVILFVVATPLFALVFSGLTLFLGLFWQRFETTGHGGFAQLYKQFLIVAAIYVALSMLGIVGLLGLLVMAAAYKTVFGAGIVEALVIGVVGGLIGWVLFVALLMGVVAVGLQLG